MRPYGYPDLGLVGELVKSSVLTRQVEGTNMLPFKFTPAVLTEEPSWSLLPVGRLQVLPSPS